MIAVSRKPRRVCGVGQMIKGFDQAVANMEVGESVEIHLMPEEAYMLDPAAIFTLEIAQLPGSEELEAGQQVYLSNCTAEMCCAVHSTSLFVPIAFTTGTCRVTPILKGHPHF